ncbi:hypothetical protein, partial [Parasphingorhabdus sp.]|uniref:hypothetical protein n=1 Tax=Parasphingorhabdus sp. TaxID=2709688 RepID=UPI00359344B4
MRWLAGGSVAAAAFLLATAPQVAQAQSLLRVPGMMMENAPHGKNVNITRPEMAQNQSHNRAPDFRANDIRISSPLNPLPTNNIRISAPISSLPVNDVRISTALNPSSVQDIRISAPAALAAAQQPQMRADDFNPRDVRISSPMNPLPENNVGISAPITSLPVNDVRISAPAQLGLENIQINTPVTLSDAYQPQVPAGMTAINQAQDVDDRISLTRAFQANPTFASAFATISRSPDSDVLTVTGSETFINWSPLDTANGDQLINILPGGTSLTFVGPDSGYTVLNRILPTGTTVSGDPRGIAFGGNVTSRLGSSDGSIGGNIWFYSPGGIVIGAGSTFDVGGLVLTSNDIDTTGGLFGAGGEIRFNGVADSLSSVTIENGATINALNNGSSYVAMVAPRVVQGGTVT